MVFAPNTVDCRFEIPDLATGYHDLSVRAPGLIPKDMVSVLVRAGPEPTEVTLRVPRAWTVAGIVVDPQGRPTPVKAATVLAYWQGTGVVPSFSRPSVTNDYSYSESLFRTAKYRPEFPRKPFASLEEACTWATWFARWYAEHGHSAIKFVTLQQRQDGEDVEILARRKALYEAAKARHPNRWSKAARDWSRPQMVALNPKPGTDAASREAAWKHVARRQLP